MKLRHSLAALALAATLVRTDLERRLRPTFLGWAWYFAPLLTAIAISGGPWTISGQSSNISRFIRITLYVCSLQLLTDIGHETARLIRRNRTLLPALGADSIVFNIAGLTSAVSQFAAKILVFALVFCILPTGRETLLAGLVNLLWVLPPIGFAGLALSFTLSYLSLLYIDLRYAAPFLPMLLILVSPSVNPLDETYRLNSLFSPLSLISPLFSPPGTVTPGWLVGATAIQTLVLAVICVGLVKLQGRIASVVITSYV
jgi:ABC-type polysaccharide/polyol phosphate export permease